MKERVATEGLALAGLHRPIFDKVVSGEIPAARGAIIGGSGLSHEQQSAVMQRLDKLPKSKAPSDSTLRETIENAKAAPVVKKTTHDLFGSSEEDVSLALPPRPGAASSHIKKTGSDREKQ